ncbi:putative glycosyltransferase [Vitis vinifera]|uniref:Putative glycosyltransferase n=1 Tax=Vitis vinifera TaxID=29760 RepID=A0A438CWE3_VITVI|nr:putative glycosyltransferase [Vitis vinifera]
MATLSSTPYIVFPVLLFFFFFPSFLSPINQNPDLRFHPSSSSTPNHSQTKHQTPEASSFLGNVSTHGVPSTSTTTGEKMSPLERIEGGLASARAAIREAKWEKRFKIWTYKEGDQPLVHGGPKNSIYGIEGQFMDEMESGDSHFVAGHPDEAHVFYIPISVTRIAHYIYSPPVDYSGHMLQRLVTDYIYVVSDKYPYWNRSNGADHFLVSCHDWVQSFAMPTPPKGSSPSETSLCQKSTYPKASSAHLTSTNPPNQRHILAFFAGRESGYMRTLLFRSWKENDDEVQWMGSCQPRVVEAIAAGCVPVIICDYYVLPFSEVLVWSKFSINITSDKIPEIKKILKAVPNERYLRMQKRVKQVQRHFVINPAGAALRYASYDSSFGVAKAP